MALLKAVFKFFSREGPTMAPLVPGSPVPRAKKTATAVKCVSIAGSKRQAGVLTLAASILPKDYLGVVQNLTDEFSRAKE